ncbi:hypothetical protein PSM7751_00977 [Pseudooceanicola marinus]|uniref:Uncharacterized protein n=1 Tax=Pseudooceanicola marinus TaxID=396013 RepID=A0A1X6YP78_9RHOB|nr:hypothetical protein [Pseudooceanicola marinus]PJE29459.1 hypothetical protein CVM50_13210 [Pseudooceanicola marinus]SLN26673.1 hypothetical protein PSM7751_00977 [Pseudooceanicola marinus]
MRMTPTSRKRSANLQDLHAAVDAAMEQLSAGNAGSADEVLRDSGVVSARLALRRRGGVAVLSHGEQVSDRSLCAA